MLWNYTKSQLILKAMMLLDKFSCRHADKVIVVGRDMVENAEGEIPEGEDPQICLYQ